MKRKHTACFNLKRTLELSFCAPTLPSLLVYQTDNTTQTFTPQWDWFALARIAQAATSSDAVKPALTMSWALLCVSSCVMCATACYLYCGTVGGIVKTPPYIYTRVPRGRLKIRELCCLCALATPTTQVVSTLVRESPP